MYKFSRDVNFADFAVSWPSANILKIDSIVYITGSYSEKTSDPQK